MLAVFDAGTPWTPQDKELLSALDARAICVLNKTDLPVRKSLPGSIEVSCLTGEGLDELQRAILKALDAPQAGENALVCERHIALAREALAEIRAALDAAARACRWTRSACTCTPRSTAWARSPARTLRKT